MSRDSEDNFHSINSTNTDLYQETIKRFTRSSLSPEMDRFSTIRFSLHSNTTRPQESELNQRRRSSNDFYIEATGRRRSSDQGAVLTQDTEQFIIGQKVWVGGVKPGQIAYIGETHFAPGEWAGIVLDEPNGKNDGCVAGKRYFQCEPKRGIFSRLTRLTLAPLTGAQRLTSPLQKQSPERSRTGSPTTSLRSTYLGKSGLTVGDRVIVSSGFGSRPGILRYLGETKFATGNWCGVELDEPTGKNDGSVEGVRYFECKPKYGVFVPIAKVSLSPSSRKTRLSRTGSRESLTSVGTINSIATTNTSRLRMSSQRKSPTIKPVTTPKPQFSMQEILREKQSHIEKLMIERELDREDSQNQALQYQKNINELRLRITQLEHELIEERKTAEDLQFSIDEATFCGDELKAQTQVYKEKIQDLEKRINEQTSKDSSNQKLETKLKEQCKVKNEIEEKFRNLEDTVIYLRKENENLQKELMIKDEQLEKFSTSENSLTNEIDLLKKVHVEERTILINDLNSLLEAKNEEIRQLLKEITNLRNAISSSENDNEHIKIQEKCRVLEKDCKNYTKEIDKLKDQLAVLSSELTVKTMECLNLNERNKTQETEETLKYKKEITQLKLNKKQLENENSMLQRDFETLQNDLYTLKEVNTTMKNKIDQISKEDADKENTLNDLQIKLNNINEDHKKLIAINKDLNETVKELRTMYDKEKSTVENLTATIIEKNLLLEKTAEELNDHKTTVIQLEAQIKRLNDTNAKQLKVKSDEITILNQELNILQDKGFNFENQSSNVVQQLTDKVKDLEANKTRLEDKILHKEIELKNMLDKNHSERKILESQLQSGKQKIDDLYKQMETLTEELNLSDDKCIKYNNLLKEQQQKHNNLEIETNDITRKLESLLKKHENLQDENIQIQNKLSNAKMEQQKQQNLLELLTNENEHKNKLLESSKKKIEELKHTIDDLKLSNQNISKTNADLSAAMERLENDKCEMNNIFELFEMESDQNITKLIETITKQKQQLNNTLSQLTNTQNNLENKDQIINSVNERLQNTEATLHKYQNELLIKTTKLNELENANTELKSRIVELEAANEENNDFKEQLNEYKKIIGEMDNTLNKRSASLIKIEQELQKQESMNIKAQNKEKELQTENQILQRKLELIQNEKNLEVVQLQERINDLQSIVLPICTKQTNGNENNDDKSSVQNVVPIAENSTAHINFLNSIIVDMQRKNDTLKAKIEALEAIPTDFTKPHAFDLIAKRKPTLRLFCDICDEFDKHETEDCPLQASENTPPSRTDPKERKIPEPRKYCENCEVFGHDTIECDDDKCY